MIFLQKKIKVQKSSSLRLKNIQKFYISAGLIISLTASFALFVNANNANKRNQYWVASKQIAVGEALSDKNLELVSLDLGKVEKLYFDSNKELINSVATKPISNGELINAQMVGSGITLRKVALKISTGHLPPTLEINDWVDIWFSDPLIIGTSILTSRVPVVWIDEINDSFGGSTTVVVAVPESLVDKLIIAARTDGIDLVQREN